MTEKIRVLIQMRHTAQVAASVGTRDASAVAYPGMSVSGLTMDQQFSAVAVPRRFRNRDSSARASGSIFGFDHRPQESTYVMRGEVEDQTALDNLMTAVDQDSDGVGVYADPRISGSAVCPPGSIGSDTDVENRLLLSMLQNRGMDGAGVAVAIVDTGINLGHLAARGKQPQFDAQNSWSPVSGSQLGSMPVGHGTMCAFDVCIAAPNCTLYDYALLESQTSGQTAMEGFLSDAVAGFSQLLTIMTSDQAPAALVVNNSWGMFHPSWDFPVGHPGNYSDNPDHPFNIIVESLDDAGADILFAAGNCGSECPDGRCDGATDEGIFGANSSSNVLCIAGATVDQVRVGYSTQGPGRLDTQKPDLTAYTHFSGSGALGSGTPDVGTSAACPVAAGLVAAIRTQHSAAALPPAQLRNLLRRSAQDLGMQGFDFDHGFGMVDTENLLAMIDRRDTQPLLVGQSVSGNITESGQSVTYKLNVGSTLNVALDGPPNADFDIYVRRGAEPTVDNYDFRGYTNSATEKLRIEGAEPGEYYVMVRSYNGNGPYTLSATIDG